MKECENRSTFGKVMHKSRCLWFYHATLCVVQSLLCVVSVRPSRSCIGSTQLKISSNFFSPVTPLLGRLPKVDLIILEGKNVRPSVRPSVRPQKVFFDLNEIWYVGRGRWVMHDSMPYGRIQGQGHEPFKVWIPSIFKTYLLRHLPWELASDH